MTCIIVWVDGPARTEAGQVGSVTLDRGTGVSEELMGCGQVRAPAVEAEEADWELAVFWVEVSCTAEEADAVSEAVWDVMSAFATLLRCYMRYSHARRHEVCGDVRSSGEWHDALE
jgi:hypothetical protein